MMDQALPRSGIASRVGGATGLSEAEAAQRLRQCGENALIEHRVEVLERLARFLWGPIPWMIEAAAGLSAALGHWEDLAVILAMLLINASVGFWKEFKADNAIELLRQRLALKARVRRDGAWKDIEARFLVPGDLVHVKLGNVIPAALNLTDGSYLSVDQPALTGESRPVDKKVGDEAYSGSVARQGEMDGIVTATGMKRYFGKTARFVEQARTVSHFQRAVLLIVVYRWLIAPTGWRLALMVWGYALASFMAAGAIKVGMYRLLAHGVRWQAHHLAWIEQHVST
jgi:H+-transporting ATPase